MPPVISTSGGLQPGERAPDLEVTANEGKTRLYQVLRHGRHVLLISGPGPGGDLQPKMRPWQDQIDVVTQENSHTDRPRLGPGQNVYLLRPDGYVAVRGSVTRPDSLLDYLHRLFAATRAPQPTPASAPPA